MLQLLAQVGLDGFFNYIECELGFDVEELANCIINSWLDDPINQDFINDSVNGLQSGAFNFSAAHRETEITECSYHDLVEMFSSLVVVTVGEVLEKIPIIGAPLLAMRFNSPLVEIITVSGHTNLNIIKL